MVQHDRQPAPGDLEGLILSDGGGACYAVPTIVIERYRLAADEVMGYASDDARPGGSELPPAWSVVGAIYVPAHPTDKRFT